MRSTVPSSEIAPCRIVRREDGVHLREPFDLADQLFDAGDRRRVFNAVGTDDDVAGVAGVRREALLEKVEELLRPSARD